jgi:hypothetical protein
VKPWNAWHLTDEGELACYLMVDIHHGINRRISVDPILESSRAIRYGERRLMVPAPEWSLFHLVFKIYWEGIRIYRSGLYKYADLLRILPTLDDASVTAFLDLVRSHKLEVPAYYVLRRVEASFGVAVPDEIARFVQRFHTAGPSDHTVPLSDLGDMWPKLWGRR